MPKQPSLPLAGKRIVVTRAPQQAAELTRHLTALGAQVILLPLVDFAAVEDFAALDESIRNLPQFDWLLFTSQNAVRFYAERCVSQGIDLARLPKSGPKIAAVGPATADAAGKVGLIVDRVARKSLGAGLVEELSGTLEGKRILLPRSDHARPELPAALRSAGADVVEVVAYRTVAPVDSDAGSLTRILRGEVDVIIFASPSAFQHLEESAGTAALQALSERVAFAAIGPVTAAALREAGTHVAIDAQESTSAGLADAIVKYYSVLLDAPRASGR